MKRKYRNASYGSVLVFVMILCCVIFLVGSTILNVIMYHHKARVNYEWSERAADLAEFGAVRIRHLMIRTGMQFPPVSSGESYTYTFYDEQGRCDIVISELGSNYYRVISTGIVIEDSKVMARRTITVIIDKTDARVLAYDEEE